MSTVSTDPARCQRLGCAPVSYDHRDRNRTLIDHAPGCPDEPDPRPSVESERSASAADSVARDLGHDPR